MSEQIKSLFPGVKHHNHSGQQRLQWKNSIWNSGVDVAIPCGGISPSAQDTEQDRRGNSSKLSQIRGIFGAEGHPQPRKELQFPSRLRRKIPCLELHNQDAAKPWQTQPCLVPGSLAEPIHKLKAVENFSFPTCSPVTLGNAQHNTRPALEGKGMKGAVGKWQNEGKNLFSNL